MSQSMTKEGDIFARAAEDLSNVSDVLVCCCEYEGQLGVRRQVVGDHWPVFVLLYGAKLGGGATVRPLDPNRSVRILASGNGRPGDILRARIDGTGRVYSGRPGFPIGPVVGIAEEPFIDGQLVRMRPCLAFV